MTEHIHQNEAARGQELEPALAFHDTLSKIIEFGQEATVMKFLTEDEASLYGSKLADMAQEKMSLIEGVREVDLTVSGEGVRVPNVTFIPAEFAEDRSGTAVILDTNQPLRKLELFEELPARFDAFCVRPMKSEADGMYHIEFSMLARVGRTEHHEIPIIEGMTLPLVSTMMHYRTLIALDGTSEVSVDEVVRKQELQESEALVEKYARNPVVGGAFGRYLNRTVTALRTENEQTFTDMKNVRLIRALGRAGAAQARVGMKESEIISRTLLYKFGHMRDMRVVYDEMQADDSTSVTKYASGKLVEVVMPRSIDDTAQASFALEGVSGPENDDPEEGIHLIPLTQIRTLRF